VTLCKVLAIPRTVASLPLRAPIMSDVGSSPGSPFGIAIIESLAMLKGIVTFASAFALVSFPMGCGSVKLPWHTMASTSPSLSSTSRWSAAWCTRPS